MAAVLKDKLQGHPASVFIDGEAGTTGLQIRDRLSTLAGINVISIDAALRKDDGARLKMMQQADVLILCLPDDAARAAVALADTLGDNAPAIIDASTAHRVDPTWVYGFAEWQHGHADAIAKARRVSNPGCYPTGAIALLHPLISRGLVPTDFAISINAVSGYSGGGRPMIEAYTSGHAPAFELYGLSLSHKHVPEIMTYANLEHRPLFVPSVGNFAQGMLVSIPVHLAQLPIRLTATAIRHALDEHYAGSDTVRVLASETLKTLEPQALNGTDNMELYVFGHDDGEHALLVARLDNLGKGAAGAAVQNLKLMTGISAAR